MKRKSTVNEDLGRKDPKTGKVKRDPMTERSIDTRTDIPRSRKRQRGASDSFSSCGQSLVLEKDPENRKREMKKKKQRFLLSSRR